jgi:hypothetical protein
MLMPEATVNKNDGPVTGKDNVRAAGQIAHM